MNVIQPDSEGLELASSLLFAGKLVAFPTETVYGLGANATDERAVLSIFEAKGRPLTDPIIVHVHDTLSALSIFDISAVERLVVDALSVCWPGPLTIIAKSKPLIPLKVTAGTGYVGVRVPAHSLALKLLRISGLPIAAPSANRFGHVSPTKAAHVISDLGQKSIWVLNGDGEEYKDETCLHGIESSVVKLDSPSNKILILRQGAITKERIEQILRDNHIDWKVEIVTRTVKMQSSDSEELGQEAPGQAVTHYSPDVPALIATDISFDQTSSENALELTNADMKRGVVVIDFNGKARSVSEYVLAYRDLSESGSHVEAARRLFDTLRWAESITGAEYVFLPAIGPSISGRDDISGGLTDRIFRAASGKATKVVVNKI